MSLNPPLPPRPSDTSIVDQVIESLRNRIVSGGLAPGQRLIESDLTELLGVSRSSLREALRRLQADGLLTAQHNRGITVRRLSKQELLDQLAVHEALACMAARLAAESADSAPGRKRLAALFAQMDRACKHGQIVEFLALYPLFHDCIVELGGNRYLAAVQRKMQLYSVRRQFFSLIDTATMAQWHHEHATILQAIEAGAGSRAARAMAQHIEQFMRKVKAAEEDQLG